MVHRREILTAFVAKEDKRGFVPLAPYHKEHFLSHKSCIECGVDAPCVYACDGVYGKENGGILRVMESHVEVDFAKEGCKICGECAKACPYGVLDKELAESRNPNWNFAIKIVESACLAYQKIICNSCKDACYSVLGRENAIQFSGLFYPEIIESCVSCGVCFSVCPTHAIVMVEK